MAAPHPYEKRFLAVFLIESDWKRSSIAELLDVSEASLSRWWKRYKQEGSPCALPMGGDRHSHRSRRLAGRIVRKVQEEPSITIDEIREWLAEQGDSLARSTIWRVLDHQGCSRKKMTTLASEQQRDDVKRRRLQWMSWMVTLEALTGVRLIFIDEFCVNTKMARVYGRSLRGTRRRTRVPHGHWHTTTVVAALSADGIAAHEVYDGAMTGDRFRTWMRVLAKSLRPGDIVVCDNPSAHKVSGIDEILDEVGASIRCLPPYSPDLNPIEQAISQMKSYLGKVAAKSKEGLHDSISEAVKAVTPTHAKNCIVNSEYRIFAT